MWKKVNKNMKINLESAMNIKKRLGKRLKEIRQEHNLTQEALAESIEMSVNALSMVERGLNFVSPDLLQKLCKFYNVEPVYFFDFKMPVANKDSEELEIVIAKLKSLNKTDLHYVYKFVNNL
ncbi:helix-turn-helix transcriptional regulator [bacterium]|nr:helix-turn-helix transcriptional regulator [bacterium]